MIEINLLPKEYKKRTNVLSFDKKAIYAGIAAAALVVVMGGLTFYQSTQVSNLNRLITKARMEENRYKKDIAVIDALTEVKSKIMARVDAIEKLDQRRTFYISMLEDLNSRIPEYLWMTGFLEIPAGSDPQGASQPGSKGKSMQQPGATTGTAATASQPGKQPPQLTEAAVGSLQGSAQIEGYAFSLNSIGAFMIGMMKSDFFKNVKLNRTVVEDVGTVTAYTFKISCDLNYDAHLIQENPTDTDAGQQIGSVDGSDDGEDYKYEDFNDYQGQ
jgi:type IV pilus assembly protein PilN